MSVLRWLLGAGLAIRTVEVAVPRPIRVTESVLCLDCEAVFWVAHEFAARTAMCPRCGSRTYYPVSRWLHHGDAVGDQDYLGERHVHTWSAYQEALRSAKAVSAERKATP